MPNGEYAIAFDFDGTLIQNGPLNLDKGVHIIFSSWYACRRTGMRTFTDAGINALIERVVEACVRYPGAPRFEQFSALINALVNNRPDSVSSFEGMGLAEDYRRQYDRARDIYNRVYSALNDTAAHHFWHPYPTVKPFLERMTRHYDLYIASGVTQDLLRKDFDRHGFDSACFTAIHGGNEAGGNDKGEILKAIKRTGYRDLLFVADSNRDLEYAESAGCKFYRIQSDADYRELDARLPGDFPDERESWDFEPFELAFLREKSTGLITAYQDTDDLPFIEMARFVNQYTAEE